MRSEKFYRGLTRVFGAHHDRAVVPIHLGGSLIEATLERGSLRSAGRKAAVHEASLVLERGNSAALFGLARKLAHTAAATLSIRSHAERGSTLEAGFDADAVKGGDPGLEPDMPVHDAFSAIGLACLGHLVANEPALQRGDPEGVHQKRVALRRLRAALSLFAGQEIRHIKAELTWLTAELSPARDLDVLVSGEAAAHVEPGRRSMGALRRRLEARRSDAFARAQAAVAPPRYRRLVRDTLAWIEASDRRGDPARRRTQRRPVEDFARRELARRRRKVVRSMRKLAALDPAKRHIAVKKLR